MIIENHEKNVWNCFGSNFIRTSWLSIRYVRLSSSFKTERIKQKKHRSYEAGLVNFFLNDLLILTSIFSNIYIKLKMCNKRV